MRHIVCISLFLIMLRYTESVFVQVRWLNACSHLVYFYINRQVYTVHTMPLHLLPMSLNMGTRELSVNKWENKVTGITSIWKSISNIFLQNKVVN